MTLKKTQTYNGSATAEVLLEWSPVTYQGQAVDIIYTIDIMNIVNLTLTNDTNITISVPYNTNNTITVTAAHCRDFSIQETFKLGNNFYIYVKIEFYVDFILYHKSVNCSSPSTVVGVVIESYYSTTVGAQIYYNCDKSYLPKNRVMSVCGSDGSWSPDPTMRVCQRGNVSNN